MTGQVAVGAQVTPDTAARLDRLAGGLGVTRATIIRKALTLVTESFSEEGYGKDGSPFEGTSLVAYGRGYVDLQAQLLDPEIGEGLQ